jgi:hypothetical protein
MIHLIKFLLKVLCTPIGLAIFYLHVLLAFIFWKRDFMENSFDACALIWNIDLILKKNYDTFN